MTTFLHDIRYGFRMLLKHKGFTAVPPASIRLSPSVPIENAS
jgi:hypothetical protein